MTIEENDSDRGARQAESEGLFRPADTPGGAAKLRAANARAAEEMSVANRLLAAGVPRVGEIRTTSSTGGEKGVKEENYALLPKIGLDAVARLYNAGAQKYAAHNWRRGYEWSKSFSAMMRHAWAFWDGEDIDPETGQPHAACVVFHAFALLEFMERFPEFDDRYVPDGRGQSRDELIDENATLRQRILELEMQDVRADMAAPEVDVTIVPVNYLEKRVAVGADLLSDIPISAWEAAKEQDGYSWGGATITQERLDELIEPYVSDLLNESATRRSD